MENWGDSRANQVLQASLGTGQWFGVFIKHSSTTPFLEPGQGVHHKAGLERN